MAEGVVSAPFLPPGDQGHKGGLVKPHPRSNRRPPPSGEPIIVRAIFFNSVIPALPSSSNYPWVETIIFGGDKI
jgi:hypothetical protein